jgi:DNA modification methylase
MEANRILCGDAVAMLKTLPDKSVDCCITSPPYYGLRDYGAEGQIGVEQTPDEYISRLSDVFGEVRRVLNPTGTLWLNIADSYAGSGKGAGYKNYRKSKQRYVYAADDPAVNIPKSWGRIKPKDMIGIPWTLALALRDSGWYLRSDIIWHKPNAMPNPVKDRPVSAYEHIFLMSKSRKYHFDFTALEVPVANSTVSRYKRGFHSDRYADGAPGQTPQSIQQPRTIENIPKMRRGRDVWSISTNNCNAAHFATFPVELVKPCILAGCRENGIVLDPFFGSGTVGAAALMLGRKYVGIELNPEYCTLAKNRIAATKKDKPMRETGGHAQQEVILC